MKVYIETYGCTSNQNDSEIMAGLLHEKGHELVNEKDADVVVLNTCGVKSTTENRILYRIQKLKNRKLIVAGCMADAEYNIIKKAAPCATLIGTNSINSIAEAAEFAFKSKTAEFFRKEKIDKTLLPKYRENKIVEKVEIESGCNFSCSFCSTKLAKKYTFSYKPENIVKIIQHEKSNGAKEFLITGQDVAGYKYNNVKLPQLVDEITKNVRGIYFLRIGMMHPASVLSVLDELIEAYKSDKVFKFLHLPIQSGSDSILKKMNRTNNVDDFRLIVKSFRKAFPKITVWTDMICGFPRETDEDFHLSMELLEEVKPDFTNVSAYGVRPDTAAAKMRHVKTDAKKDRTREMSMLVDRTSLECNRKWIGWSGSVLVDEFKKDKLNYIGRNFAYKPVVLKNGAMGDFVNVKITGAERTCLITGDKIC